MKNTDLIKIHWVTFGPELIHSKFHDKLVTILNRTTFSFKTHLAVSITYTHVADTYLFVKLFIQMVAN